MLTLDEAKAHLNITATTYDVELGSFIAEAEAVIAARCGPLGQVTSTARVRGGRVLLLPSPPVVSLTSVTPVGGVALTLTDLHLDGAAGVVMYNLGGTFAAAFYDVVDELGRESIPDDLLLAVKELLRHLWSTSQRGGSRRPGSEAMATAAFLLPYQVQSLIEPHLQPGFA